MSELEKYQAPSVEHLWRYATAYSGSQLFPDVQSAEQAFVKISAGAELGLQPFQSMNGIDVIKGRPVVKPALLAGMLDSSPDFSYTVTWEGEKACTIAILRRGTLMGESRFSMDDAERAGLLKPSRNGAPSNYLIYPRNMLWSRAMSNAVRWYAPGLTMGPVYVEGEIIEDTAHAAPPVAPAHAEPKPRTRVTAEVIPDTPEDVPAADVELDYDPVTLPPLSTQLKTMSLQDRADLYDLIVIPKGTPIAAVRERLELAEKRLGLEPGDEPDAAAILACARAERAASLPDDAADTFDHFAKTGQDLSEDPQTAIA